MMERGPSSRALKPGKMTTDFQTRKSKLDAGGLWWGSVAWPLPRGIQ
jgi:hypothetical protein